MIRIPVYGKVDLMRIHQMSRAKALHLRDKVVKFKIYPTDAGNIKVINGI